MSEEIRAFAQRLLLGSRLEDKRRSSAALTDAAPGDPIGIPTAPGRPPTLQIAATAAPFPAERELHDASARGRALHCFANHELLAIELMALALLRFPTAPPAFRRALVATIADEQRHLTLYIERMRTLGIEFGDAPVGGFFWRAMAATPSPAAFVAHMSLTFEQANLDHASHYAEIFGAVGDEESAALMRAIYEDEIRHVKLGATWLQRFSPDVALIDAHRRALAPPVTLRRARGPTFDRDGRRRAGLPGAYIEAVERVPAARGRAPVVHHFDPTAELELAQQTDYTPPAALRRRIEDLEMLPMFYARPDDIVWVRRAPRPEFLAQLRAAGLRLPEFSTRPDAEEFAAVAPWAWTPGQARRMQPLRARARDDSAPTRGWPAAVFDKARGVAVLRALLRDDPRLRSAGVVAPDHAAVQASLRAVRRAGHAMAVIKAPYGTAGRGLLRVRQAELEPAQAGFVARVLARHGSVVVEPWLDRVCDLSLRLRIDAPGAAHIEGLGRVFVDARGQYAGAVIGRITDGLDPELRRFVHGLQDVGAEPWPEVARAVAAELAPYGYVGPVGVDAFVYRDLDGRLRLRPVVELNPRAHMGLVAHRLQRLVAPGQTATWRLLPAEHARETMSRGAPLQMRAGRITAGVLATNDPECAREVVGLLTVGGGAARRP